MQSIIDTISNAYDGVIFFFKDAFESIKSFFTSLLQTLQNYYDAVITYLTNTIDSLRLFLIDLPLMVFKKVFEAIVWLFEWASDSCSFCLGIASSTGSLASSLQNAINAISDYMPGIMYALNRAGFPQAMQILTCGVLIWAAFKVLSFVKALL